jgi:predicted alpha/beta hydrolase
MQSAAVDLDTGLFVADETLELSIHYRPALTRYATDSTTFVEHSLGGSVLCLLGASLQLSLAADAITGRDLHTFLLHSVIQWRPATVAAAGS